MMIDTRVMPLVQKMGRAEAGLLVTGNVIVDRRFPERPGNLAIDCFDADSVSDEARQRLRELARAGKSAGCSRIIVQLSHAEDNKRMVIDPVGPGNVKLLADRRSWGHLVR